MIIHKTDIPLVVVSGASGSGKTTLCRRIADHFDWYYSISHTTRSKRMHEVQGRDYYFTTRDDFQKMINAGDFLEWAEVYGNFYGTSGKLIQEKINAGQGVILDVDTQGASSIRKILPHSLLVFVDTPDFATLATRLANRQTDDADEIERRLAHAAHENAQKTLYDYVIINDNLDRTTDEFKTYLQQRYSL